MTLRLLADRCGMKKETWKAIKLLDCGAGLQYGWTAL
jgi:hypothetical protein